MEGGLHGNSGGYGGAGEGEGGTGGYANIIEEYLTRQPTLQMVYEKELEETEISRLAAESELEKSKTQFLQAQVGLVDPASVELTRLMPSGAKPLDNTTLAIIAVVVWFFYSGGKL